MRYLKKIQALRATLLIGCLALATAGLAQTWDEWFNQQATKIKYLEKQIAELQILIAEVEKGYQIVQKGLQVISDIKHGDFNLHSGYFASLLTVSPAVGQSSTVTDCYALQASIGAVCQTLASQVTGSASFSSPEQSYIRSVLQSLQARITATMSDLSSLTSDGNYSLKDQERQARISTVHATLLNQYQFIQHFAAQVHLMGAQRTQEQSDAQSVQHMYSLP